MSKVFEWTSEIDGQAYDFSYRRVKGKHEITVNGKATTLKSGFVSLVNGFDEGFYLENGKEARLVLSGKNPDVAVDGVFLRSGKKYIKAPGWSVIFGILCLLIPISTVGGVLPAAIGFGGAFLCMAVSKSQLPTITRLLLCIVITGAAWVLTYSIIFATISAIA